jgi:hypothetical protein
MIFIGISLFRFRFCFVLPLIGPASYLIRSNKVYHNIPQLALMVTGGMNFNTKNLTQNSRSLKEVANVLPVFL